LIFQNLFRIKTELFAQTQAGMKSLKSKDSKTNLEGASFHERDFYGHDPNLLMNET